MPLYTYTCDFCSDMDDEPVTKDKRHSFNENPVIECDKCGEPMRRMIGLPYFNGGETAEAKEFDYSDGTYKTVTEMIRDDKRCGMARMTHDEAKREAKKNHEHSKREFNKKNNKQLMNKLHSKGLL